jgi:Ca2+-binding RTX toxin-like protein
VSEGSLRLDLVNVRGTRRFLWFFAAPLAAIVASLPSHPDVVPFAPNMAVERSVSGEAASDVVAQAPLLFAAVAHGSTTDVRYVARGPGYHIGFARDRVLISLLQAGGAGAEPRAMTLALAFENANPAVRVRGVEPQRTTITDFTPARGTAASTAAFGRVRYEDLWPGVDLLFEGNGEKLKYTLFADAGAPLTDIALSYRGIRSASIGSSGALVLQTPLGRLTDSAPVSYQTSAGARAAVASRYVLKDVRGETATFGFAFGPSYDPSKRLTVDPGIVFKSVIAGTDDDIPDGIALGQDGSIYVSGTSWSKDFPTTPGAFDTTVSHTPDTFVTKFDPTGTRVVYSTVIGGSGYDAEGRIAVGPDGSAYVTSDTTSPDFPTTRGAFDRTPNGPSYAQTVYVTKLAPSGSELDYSTLISGSVGEISVDIAVDSTGNAYILARTASPDLPVTEGAFDTTYAGSEEAFVAKLNPAGSDLVYLTYLGDTGDELPRSIAIDGAGNAYVTGLTGSPNFPTTAGAFDRTADVPSFGPPEDAFLSKINAAGSALAYSTFLEGDGMDEGIDVAVDSTGSAYVSGITSSANFPVAQAFDSALGGPQDVFLARFDESGSALVFSTYLGGDDYEDGVMGLDGAGNAYLVGGTISADFPTTPDALQPAMAGSGDLFISKVDGSGALSYSTFVSDEGSFFGDAAVDEVGVVYLATGSTSESEASGRAALRGALQVGSAEPDQDGVIGGIATQCTVEGTSSAETLTGTPGRDVICGEGGGDTIHAGGGNDIIFLGPEADRVYAGGGADSIFGGDGADWIAGEGGGDLIDGGLGADVLAGGPGYDLVLGSAGRDNLDGGSGRDHLVGGGDEDVLRGGDHGDLIEGGSRNDRLYGGSGGDRLRGGTGIDLCRGGPDRDRLSGCER